MSIQYEDNFLKASYESDTPEIQKNESKKRNDFIKGKFFLSFSNPLRFIALLDNMCEVCTSEKYLKIQNTEKLF